MLQKINILRKGLITNVEIPMSSIEKALIHQLMESIYNMRVTVGITD